MLNFNIKNNFESALPADKEGENYRRQVEKVAYSYVQPRIPSNPSLVHVSEAMVADLGLDSKVIHSDEFLKFVSGALVLPGTKPYAMAYAGHQFGNWAGQLGDGRAINLMEVEAKGKAWVLQLKGAGETPYSRSADGLAVLRSSVREHLCSEAMFSLGVPTTRSLSLSLTGDQVLRDVLYDGNPAYEKGAVVCRVAPSFVRFGNFELFAAQGDHENLQKLVDYCTAHFYPETLSSGKQKVLDFFHEISMNTLKMVVEWQRVGFVHGVMNTDNMSILGLTIDYGPYGWMEAYDPNWTPNTTDRGQKRYRFGNQGRIALWNLVRLANALYPLVGDAKPFEETLDTYQSQFENQYLDMMSQKLGLLSPHKELVDDWDSVMQLSEVDYTLFFRLLSSVSIEKDSPEGALERIEKAFYDITDLQDSHVKDRWLEWFKKYLAKSKQQTFDPNKRQARMNSVNPKYVLRNYMAQLAIDAADTGDYSLISELNDLLKKPYDEQLKYEKWFAKRPEWARTKVGCSMLSCSS